METINKVDQFFELHAEYEHKLLVINSYYNEITDVMDEAQKKQLNDAQRAFYQMIGQYTELLNRETDIDAKLNIAKNRDEYLNNILISCGIEYLEKEDEFHK